MTRENGFYWVQVAKGTWEVVEFYNGVWVVNDHYWPCDNELHAVHAERIKEPDYQP